MERKGPFAIINELIDVQQRVGEFIAGPDQTGLAGFIQEGYRTRCDQAANIPTWLTNLTPQSRETLSNFCSPYYAQRGFDGFTSEPEFTGGQCQNILYNVNFEFRRFNNNAQQYEWAQSNPFQIRGPLSISGGSTGGVCFFPTDTAQAWFMDSGVDPSRSLTTGCADVVPSYRNVVVSRVDGQPDNCGDPEPQLRPGPNPPPDPGPLPAPDPTDDPFGGPFPDLPIPDFPSPFGDFPIVAPPEAPVEVDPTTIPPTGGDGLPGLPDAVGGPAGEVNGGEEGEEVSFGSPPPGRVWVGCSIEAIVDSRLGNIPGTGPTSTVYPSVIGNCALRYGQFFGTSKRINSRFTLLGRESTAVILDGCFLQAQPGVILVVRPISAETCPESPCST